MLKNRTKLVVFGLLSLMLVAIGAVHAQTSELRVGMPAVVTLDPALGSNDPEIMFNRMIYDYLLDVAPDGTIDRRVLGGKVFGKPDELKKLTDIVWPGIRKLAREALSEFEAAGHSLVVLEAAVLFEAGWEDLVDEVWVVVVEPNQARQRLATRNGLDEAAARAVRSSFESWDSMRARAQT